MHSNIFVLKFFVFFLTVAVLKIPSSNMAHKFWYILSDLCKFLQILESGDFYFFYFLIICEKRKVKKTKKNWICIFRQVHPYKICVNP